MPIDATDIAAAIDRSPAWAKLGLTVPRERLREAALDELARCIAEQLNEGTAAAAPSPGGSAPHG